MITLRSILFAILMIWQFGYVFSEAPVVNYALKADWIGEREYLRGEGLLGTIYRPVRLLYKSPLRDVLLEWDDYWYTIWFGE